MMKIKEVLLSIIVVLLVMPVVNAAAPAIPETPAAVDGVVYARAFRLDKALTNDYHKDKPLARIGYLLVLDVNSDLVYPRQVAEPVLFVGNTTAIRVNVGYPSGKVIAIVPGHINLHKAMMWFGTPMLPEDVNNTILWREQNSARAAGVKPFAKKVIDKARAAGGNTLRLADADALYKEAVKLIPKYSPQENERAESVLGDE